VRDALLGAGNGPGHYALLLLVYASLFLLMRHANPRVELNFRVNFRWLFWGWGAGTFVGNWLLYRAGAMSFLPWLNNAFHTFLWIGLCLTFLYAGAWRKPIAEQIALFAIYSFIVKWAEHEILGTWELGHFFGIPGNLAYITGWSLLDGLYPVLSLLALGVLARFVDGIVVPRPE
jgi:hypothetical protein